MDVSKPKGLDVKKLMLLAIHDSQNNYFRSEKNFLSDCPSVFLDDMKSQYELYCHYMRGIFKRVSLLNDYIKMGEKTAFKHALYEKQRYNSANNYVIKKFGKKNTEKFRNENLVKTSYIQRKAISESSGIVSTVKKMAYTKSISDIIIEVFPTVKNIISEGKSDFENILFSLKNMKSENNVYG